MFGAGYTEWLLVAIAVIVGAGVLVLLFRLARELSLSRAAARHFKVTLARVRAWDWLRNVPKQRRLTYVPDDPSSPNKSS